MDILSISFGKKIKKMRLAQGLSQEKFALKIGMDRSYYASIEGGKRNVALRNIGKIAKGFNVTLSELFEDVEIDD